MRIWITLTHLFPSRECARSEPQVLTVGAESEIVSLGMDGLAGLQFWGCALETLSSEPAKRNLECHNIYHDRSWKLVTLLLPAQAAQCKFDA